MLRVQQIRLIRGVANVLVGCALAACAQHLTHAGHPALGVTTGAVLALAVPIWASNSTSFIL